VRVITTEVIAEDTKVDEKLREVFNEKNQALNLDSSLDIAFRKTNKTLCNRNLLTSEKPVLQQSAPKSLH
jgi:hypothetical protein